MKEATRLDDAVIGFPVYGLVVVEEGEGQRVLVAGGGGPGKSGVRNALLLYARGPDGAVRLLDELSCGSEAPTCLSLALARDTVHSDVPEVALGVNDRCWRVRLEDGCTRLSLADSAQTDYAADDAHQKAVSASGGIAVTVGADGVVRGWRWPSLERLWDLSSGERRVDDVALFVGADGRGLVALAAMRTVDVHVATAESVGGEALLSIPAPRGGTARFVRVSSDGAELFVVANACAHGRSVLGACDLSRGGRPRGVLTLPRGLRATAFDVCGMHAAVGFSDGSFVLVDLSSLSVSAHVRGVHSFVVTAVRLLVHDECVEVYTASGDGTVCVRSVSTAPRRPLLWRAADVLFVAALSVLAYHVYATE